MASYGIIRDYGVLREVVIASRPIFGDAGNRPRRNKRIEREGLDPEVRAWLDSEVARCGDARARAQIRKTILLNPWDFFFTLTFNPACVDSKNPDAVKSVLFPWIRKMERFGCSFIYIPEYHKSGAIHVHGMVYCNGFADQFIAAAINPHTGTPMYTSAGKPLYNLIDWDYGFSSCVEMGNDGEDYIKTASYVAKYISKDFQHPLPKRFYTSRGLCRNTQDFFVQAFPVDEFRRLEGVKTIRVPQVSGLTLFSLRTTMTVKDIFKDLPLFLAPDPIPAPSILWGQDINEWVEENCYSVSAKSWENLKPMIERQELAKNCPGIVWNDPAFWLTNAGEVFRDVEYVETDDDVFVECAEFTPQQLTIPTV